MFVHLHVHSFFSFLAGASSPEALCQQAKTLGYQALALTDTNGLYGAIRFLKAAKKHGLRPIFGAHLTQSLPYVWHEPSALVLAKDDQGYRELCRLITRRQLDEQFNLVRVLAQTSLHVAVLSTEVELVKQIKQQGKAQGLYLALCDHSEHGDPGRMALRIQQAGQLNLPTVITNQVYVATEMDHYVHRACRAMAQGQAFDGIDEQLIASQQAFLKSPAQMKKRFGQFSAVWERTGRLAEQCQGGPRLGKLHFPRYPFAPRGESFSYLSKLCFRGLRRRYGQVTPKALSRLAQELSVIESRRYADYFLVVWDIVKEAKRRQIPTVGRGSAANSLVAYCLEITHVDPLKHDLFFERFLNPERVDPPDIDVDFPWDQRDEMLNYAYTRFGREQVAMLCTQVILHARSAVREAGRVFGLTEEELSKFSKRLPYHSKLSELEQVIQNYPEAKTLPFKQEPWRTILKLAAKLEGLPRHLSVHPGGIIILPEPVSEIVPKQLAEKGIEVTQYDMYSAQDAGLIKIDLLGQRGLAVIRDVVKAKQVDWRKIDPEKDEATQTMMAQGRTMGCFYVESPGMRQLLKKLRCQTFETLTIASSAIRPGVSDSGMRQMFIACHLKLAPVVYAHPDLADLLKETYGVMIFQEDVIRVVHRIAGMSLGEADKLRRCMGFKHHQERITDYKQRFMQGAQSRQVTAAAAKEIWRQIESFAGFAFCKAHSASFAQLSFQAAYLKAHYPGAFMAAVLSNQGGYYGPSAYLEEARRMGLTIQGPDINRSQWAYTSHGNNLMIGLLAIENFSYADSQKIISAREKGGAFTTLGDLIRRTGLAAEKIESLIAAGACDGLSSSRVALYWQQIIEGAQVSPGKQLLPMNEMMLTPDLTDSSADEKDEQTYAQLGLSPSAHPLMRYRHILSTLFSRGMICASELEKFSGRRVVVCGWLVTTKGAEVRKTGKRMKFLTLEDFTAIYEVTLFPDVYQKEGAKLRGRGPYLIQGLVENDHQGITITAEKIDPIKTIK